MPDPYDRRVHAVMSDGSVIVRYDRAGAWYREWPADQMIQSRRLNIRSAVMYATSDEVTEVHLGLPGGRTFDHHVKAYQMQVEGVRLWQQEQGDHS